MNPVKPAWLAATEFLDYHHPAIVDFVAETLSEGTQGPGAAAPAKDNALRLYYAVRDGIRYDPYSASMRREGMRASTTRPDPCVFRNSTAAEFAHDICVETWIGIPAFRQIFFISIGCPIRMASISP